MLQRSGDARTVRRVHRRQRQAKLVGTETQDRRRRFDGCRIVLDEHRPHEIEKREMNFARDIGPLFERSCAGCHSGEKPRGGFAIVSREALLKGGASGEPAIAPGYSDDSTMIQYVTGKIEDLEMPPLDRREKYPALTAAEIDVMRAWIDAGAPWPTTDPVKTKSASVLEE